MADDNTLWVGGLADEVTEDHLYELFLQAGPLEKVMRVKEKDGSLKKFAFVEFSHAESVPYAMQVMEGVKLFNHHLRLKGRTGSQHESSHSDSSSVHSQFNQSDPRSHRGMPELNRSRSYHGHSHHMKHGGNRSSTEERRGGTRSFNSPTDPLAQPFNSIAAYNAPSMQPQSFEERRNRVLHKQGMSLAAHAQNQGGYNFNHAQSFNAYGQQQQQQPFQQQWYLNNY